MSELPYFAACPKHLELLLKDELLSLGATDAKEALAGVQFDAQVDTVLRVVMWSRLANRVMRVLSNGSCRDKNDLYQIISDIDWFQTVNQLPKSLAIRFNGTNRELKNTHFSSQVCKDAICDQLDEQYGKRPKVVKSDGHLSVSARLKHNELTVFQDLTGHSLHQRGYRSENTLAPLKENLAAAILMRAGWPEAAQQNHNLIDPMCGSGTLLLEGWQMAIDLAPNLNLKSHALFSWNPFNAHDWTTLQQEAEERAATGMAMFRGQIIGVDHHKASVALANDNLEQLPNNKRISFNYQPLDKFRIPPRNNLVVCNPPYGVRLQKNHLSSWQQLSHWLGEKANGAEAAILTPDAAKGWMVGFREQKQYAFKNGALDVQLRLFSISKANRLAVPEGQHFALPAGAQPLANRLKKRLNELKPWAVAQGIQAYRLYDADMPEFAFAIDRYQNQVVIQEYQAPKTIEAKKVQQHLEWALLAVQSVLGVPSQQLHLKTRQKQKNSSQYLKQAELEQARFIVKEQGRKYLVDLAQYLDTGLFLDHRWLRRTVQEQAKGQSVLNLFSYTGSISVAAGCGGAQSVTSVDTSKTYLAWSEENFKINKIQSKHLVVRQDVMRYLQTCQNRFDLIVVDPPTYSNSHSRDEDWDVQRDHIELLRRCGRLLNDNGRIYFSNNFRKFKMDAVLAEEFDFQDITRESMDKDFLGSKIHQCFLLKRL